MKHLHALLLIATVQACLGCATWITSERFTGKQEGFRYSLPAIVLEVAPQPDGSVKVQKHFIADPRQEYVLRPGSFLANYTFDVKAENNLLQSVKYEPDSSAVAAELVKTAGNLAGTRLDLEKAEKDANKKIEEDARKALLAAEQEAAVAQAKVDALEKLSGNAGFVPADLIKAQVELAAANAKVAAARSSATAVGLEAFNLPTDGGDGAADDRAGDAAGGGAESVPLSHAWGPVFYRVVMTQGSVSLVAMTQREFQTATTAAPVPPPPPKFTFSPEGSTILHPDGKTGMILKLVANQEFKSIDRVWLYVGQKVIDTHPPSPAPQKDDLTVIVTLRNDTPLGDYHLAIQLTVKATDERVLFDLPIVVEAAKP